MTGEVCAWEGTGWLRKWTVLAVGLYFCSVVEARPSKTHFHIDEKELNYLMDFGYIPQSDRELGNLRHEDELREALKNLQHFGNIPITGEMDDATKELIKKPRCGVPDIDQSSSRRKKRYNILPSKWKYYNLTWSLRTPHIPNLDHGQVRSELHRALDIWAKNSQLSFREVNSDRADILVHFERGYHGDGYNFDGPGHVLAHAFFPGSGRGGDAHFDIDEDWVMKPFARNPEEFEKGTSLFDVAAHEFGHSLGLGHSDKQGALMFPWYQSLPDNFDLPNDDRYGIQQMYGRREETKMARIPYPVIPYEEPRRSTPQAWPPTTRRPATRPWTPATRRPRPTDASTTTRPYVHPTHRTNHHRNHTDPAKCITSWDAISIIRGELFIFKDLYLWRIGTKGLDPEYPVKIVRFWDLPHNMSVDAVYERNDRMIVFFVGRQYFVFNANVLLSGYPKPLTDLGLPGDLEKIDGAMVWGHNSKTYLFSGTLYWRLDDDTGEVELDYPRDMSIWRGVGYNIDAVFQWKDGNTYFFKNHKFWKFDDLRMRVADKHPKQSAPFWLNCPAAAVGQTPVTSHYSASAHITKQISVVLLTLPLLYIQYTYLFLFL